MKLFIRLASTPGYRRANPGNEGPSAMFVSYPTRHAGTFHSIHSIKMPAGSSISSPKDDPRRPNKIFRYKPVPNKPTDDPTPEYMNLLGMIFSMCGLLMKVNRSSGNRSCDG